jgi:hypothetical protein
MPQERIDTDLPSPGRSLVVRLTSAKGAPQTLPPARPHPNGQDNDYLKQTLKDSEPYLTGGK